ncbi:MAG: sugar ABC transporter permease [Caldilineaceae bacterium]|nr:sugar ABC transporter permease [Caldilineaceae bacterium]
MVALRRLLPATQREWRNFLLGIGFASPWIIGFLAFTIFPVGSALYYSFTRYDLVRDPVWLGVQNYVAFADDADFRLVAGNTLWWVLLSSPLGVFSAFLMALLLNSRIVFRSFFRAIFFFPAIVPVVVTAFVWIFLLNIQYGAINSTLQAWGFKTIPFISSPDWMKWSLVVIHMWSQGAAMVIFLATLQDVPKSLYEAATVDGANAFRRMWNITVPMVSPIILFNLVMSFISGFQYFTLPWIMTQGGPSRSAEFYAIYLYRNAFQWFRMGKASALAWVLFVLILLFTYLIFRTSGRFVYYAGATR